MEKYNYPRRDFDQKVYLSYIYDKYLSLFEFFRKGNYEVIQLLTDEQLCDLLGFYFYCVDGEKNVYFKYFYEGDEFLKFLNLKPYRKKDFLTIIEREASWLSMRFTMFKSIYLLDEKVKRELFEELNFDHRQKFKESPINQNPFLN